MPDKKKRSKASTANDVAKKSKASEEVAASSQPRRKDGRLYVPKNSLTEEQLLQAKDQAKAKVQTVAGKGGATEEDKKEEKRVANRLAAFQSRKRRKDAVTELKSSVSELTALNEDQLKQILEQKAQLQAALDERARLEQEIASGSNQEVLESPLPPAAGAGNTSAAVAQAPAPAASSVPAPEPYTEKAATQTVPVLQPASVDSSSAMFPPQAVDPVAGVVAQSRLPNVLTQLQRLQQLQELQQLELDQLQRHQHQQLSDSQDKRQQQLMDAQEKERQVMAEAQQKQQAELTARRADECQQLEVLQLRNQQQLVMMQDQQAMQALSSFRQDSDPNVQQQQQQQFSTGTSEAATAPETMADDNQKRFPS